MRKAYFTFIAGWLLCLQFGIWAEVHEFIALANEEHVEVYYQKPDGAGPFPVIFVIHGQQPIQNSIGAKQVVEYLNLLADEGIMGVAISMPGYGQSSGKRDFCGPNSQEAVIFVVKHFKDLSFVDSSRMGLYGISRGAILSSLVSCHCSDISLQILEAGFYDLTSRGLQMPFYLHEIQKNIIRESGGEEESIIQRSAVFFADNISAKTLFLFGEFDDRKGLPSAQVLHEKLIARGIESRIHIFQNAPHVLGQQKWEIIIPYLRAKFFDVCGIGINVSRPMPVPQILKISPGSSADSTQLKVGDAILSISPLNDEKEIIVFDMPMKKFLSLILGPKGSFLRLQVQHFDGSLESIIVERS